MARDAKKLQQKYLELQVIDQQMKQLQRQLQLIESQMMEVTMTKEALNELGAVSKGTEMLAPISGGIFVRANLADSNKLAVNVGAGTVVEKTIPEVIRIMEEQESEIRKTYNSLAEELQKLGEKALEIQEELSK